MSDNLKTWNAMKQPPPSALKAIQAGRLKGKSDINPQWRFQVMTEQFGPCGIGWKYTIDKLWLERGAPVKCREANVTEAEVAAFALISLYFKSGDQWSEPIPGIGGSMFTESEKSSPFNSDEAFKMAVTDGLSVAMKALGVAADVYMGLWDGSKYRTVEVRPSTGTGNAGKAEKPKAAAGEKTTAEKLLDELADWCKGDEEAMETALAQYSEFSGKHLTLQRLRNPDADPERRVKVMKWAGSTLGKIREKREVKELCNECRQPMTGGKCVNQSCPNCEPV